MLDILYNDGALVAVAKPSGLLVHRSSEATDRITCMTILRDQLGARVHPAHRLDRGTSGVLLFSLDPDTARSVASSFAGRDVKKHYLTVTRGYAPDEGTIDYPLAEEPGDEAAEAVTSYRTLARVELPWQVGRYATARYSLLLADPMTGRRHQIRRHMAHIRHPIVGDIVHGEGRHNRLYRERFGIHRLLLHAWRVELPHPRTGEQLRIEAPLPEELRSLFSMLGWSDPLPGW